jgi:hypothetical protein
MPGGVIGDHPFTDIVLHGRAVYSPTADALVREIAALGDERTRRELAERLITEFNVNGNPDVGTLERSLRDWRDGLRREARERGFEA